MNVLAGTKSSRTGAGCHIWISLFLFIFVSDDSDVSLYEMNMRIGFVYEFLIRLG